MGENVWCVKPATRTISGLKFVNPDTGVEHEFWIKVKERLTTGEKKRTETSGFGGVRPGAEGARQINMDWEAMAYARAEMYLVDWSLERDPEKHEKLPLTRDVIESLHEDMFAAIEVAITKHVEEMAAAKKLKPGSSVPEAKSA